MDKAYLSRRFNEALEAARNAAEPCARIAHNKMADAYGLLLDAITAPINLAGRLGRGRSHQRDFERALDEWDNEGGGLPR